MGLNSVHLIGLGFWVFQESYLCSQDAKLYLDSQGSWVQKEISVLGKAPIDLSNPCHQASLDIFDISFVIAISCIFDQPHCLLGIVAAFTHNKGFLAVCEVSKISERINLILRKSLKAVERDVETPRNMTYLKLCGWAHIDEEMVFGQHCLVIVGW